MNILFLTTSFPRFEGDGTAPFVKSLADGMVSLGNNVFVLAPFDVNSNKNFILKNITLYRFKYFIFDSWHIMGHSRALKSDIKLNWKVFLLLPFFIFFQLIHSFRIIRKENIDMIYAHWVIPNGFTGAMLKILTKRKLLISLHGSDIFLAKKNQVLKYITNLIFTISDNVTACSEDLFQFATKNGANQKIKLIPWGADPQKFFPLEKRKINNVNNLKKMDGEIFIISIGRLVYKKGFDILIQASQKILRENDHVKLIIGGSGELETELKQLSNDLDIGNKVIFCGTINWNEVVDFLRLGDLFVLPSIIDKSGNIDGLPTVLLEAMSTGLPIIASDIGGVNLVIIDDENGLLIDSGDISSLEEKISYLLNNPIERFRLGKQARNSVIEKYNWKSVSQDILDFVKRANNY